MHADNTAFKLTEVLDLAVKKVGVKGVTIHLKDLLRDHKFSSSAVFCVVKEVADSFGIGWQEIIFGTSRTTLRADAAAFCAYYLHHFLDLKVSVITVDLRKEKSLVGKYIHKIEDLDPRFRSDSENILRKNNLDSKLFPFKSKK